MADSCSLNYVASVDLDLSHRDALVAAAKRHIRARMKSLRQGMPAKARAERSRAVVERVIELEAWKQARSVALYAPLTERGEIDVRALDAEARRAGRRVFYPGLDDASRPILAEASLDALADRGRGFYEAPPEARVANAGEVDLVVVPALAVDGEGYRVGYGSGFYDEVLAGDLGPHITVVVAFQFQLLGEVPRSEHDLPCDWVVTDAATLHCVGGRTRADEG